MGSRYVPAPLIWLEYGSGPTVTHFYAGFRCFVQPLFFRGVRQFLGWSATAGDVKSGSWCAKVIVDPQIWTGTYVRKTPLEITRRRLEDGAAKETHS